MPKNLSSSISYYINGVYTAEIIILKAPAQHWEDRKTKISTDLHITYMV